MKRFLVVLSISLMSGCAASRGISTSPALPSTEFRHPDTAKVASGTVFVGLSSGTVEYSSPPYRVWKQTNSVVDPVTGVAVTSQGDIVVATNTATGNIWYLQRPYKTHAYIGAVPYAVAIGVDAKDEIFAAGENITKYAPFLAPTNTKVFAQGKTFVTQSRGLLVLPNGTVAVTYIGESKHGFKPGNVGIYKPPYTTRVSIASVKYPAMLIAGKAGAILVGNCSNCVSAGNDDYLASIGVPYRAPATTIAKLKGTDIIDMVVDAQQDIIVTNASAATGWKNQISLLAPPYTRSRVLPGTLNGFALGISASGDLFFSTASAPYGVYMVRPPYTSGPKKLISLSALAGGITVYH